MSEKKMTPEQEREEPYRQTLHKLGPDGDAILRKARRENGKVLPVPTHIAIEEETVMLKKLDALGWISGGWKPMLTDEGMMAGLIASRKEFK